MNKIKGECYDCQYKKRKGEIGDMKKFNNSMLGNTISLEKCDTCGEDTGILPYGDMDRSIRYSNGEFVHPLEWD